jgi:hypothetical protein
MLSFHLVLIGLKNCNNSVHFQELLHEDEHPNPKVMSKLLYFFYKDHIFKLIKIHPNIALNKLMLSIWRYDFLSIHLDKPIANF